MILIKGQIIIIVVYALVKTAYCSILNENQIKVLKWTDGVVAVVFGLLWVLRQRSLTLMYNGANLRNVRLLYYVSTAISAILLMGLVVFIVATAVLSCPNDIVYSNTLTIFVGVAISIVLDKRRQFDIGDRARLVSSMLAKDKFRVGKLTLKKLSEVVHTPNIEDGLFKITKGRMPRNGETEWKEWSGLKYKINGKFYIEDWSIEHRIYGMDTESFAKHMGKYGQWRDALLEASLSIGWLPSHYINKHLFTHLKEHAKNERGIRDSIPTWKGYMLDVQDIDLNKDISSKEALGLYVLAIMETPEKARNWLVDWENALEKMYKENYIYDTADHSDITKLNRDEVSVLDI